MKKLLVLAAVAVLGVNSFLYAPLEISEIGVRMDVSDGEPDAGAPEEDSRGSVASVAPDVAAEDSSLKTEVDELTAEVQEMEKLAEER